MIPMHIGVIDRLYWDFSIELTGKILDFIDKYTDLLDVVIHNKRESLDDESSKQRKGLFATPTKCAWKCFWVYKRAAHTTK